MNHITEGKSTGLRMKDEGEFTENHTGCRLGWHGAFQTDIHKSTGLIFYLRTAKQFPMTGTSVAWRELVRSKTEAVRSYMTKALSFYTQVFGARLVGY